MKFHMIYTGCILTGCDLLSFKIAQHGNLNASMRSVVFYLNASMRPIVFYLNASMQPVVFFLNASVQSVVF